MNPWHAYCEALAAHLRLTVPPCTPAEPEATRIDVVVFRQGDLYSTAEAMTSKASGQCIIVSHLGGKNPDPSAKTLRMGGIFSISVWKLPEIASDLTPDDLCWMAAKQAQGFASDAGPNNLQRRLEISTVGITPDKKFLIWEAAGTVKRLAIP